MCVKMNKQHMFYNLALPKLTSFFKSLLPNVNISMMRCRNEIESFFHIFKIIITYRPNQSKNLKMKWNFSRMDDFDSYSLYDDENGIASSSSSSSPPPSCIPFAVFPSCMNGCTNAIIFYMGYVFSCFEYMQ